MIPDQSRQVENFERPKEQAGAAIVAGVLAAALGAASWVAISLWFQGLFGVVAVMLGWLVGEATLYFGRGESLTLAVIAGVLAFLGCAAGVVIAASIGEWTLGWEDGFCVLLATYVAADWRVRKWLVGSRVRRA